MVDVKRWSAALVLTLAACATTASTPSIYYKSQAEADAAFAAFDKDNPDCQLWTNWQKMCSRTGANGTTYCNTDPDIPVKPSVPFCFNQHAPQQSSANVQPTKSYIEMQKNSQSRNRFCKEFLDNGPDLEFEIAQNPNYLNTCVKYHLSRPFNGMSIKSQKNPRCKKWTQDKGGFFYCSEAITDEKCADIKRIRSTFEVAENGLAVGREFRSEQFAIWGLSCIDTGGQK
jgi:hypothetical protein